jgi:hypothetical protein
MIVTEGPPKTYLDRDNPYFGALQSSNVVEATIKQVHTDEANNVTFTADVVTVKGEPKWRVPFLFPYANAIGTAGIMSVPNVGDSCVVALLAGNSPYIIGYHSVPQVEEARSSAAAGSAAPLLKGTFAKSQLTPGGIEFRTPRQNRLLLHPGGSIDIEARNDLFTFYDAVSSTIENLSRNVRTFTAGGTILWTEGKEKAQQSMEFLANLYTKSVTQENLDKGELRGGAKMTVLFSEKANHFFLEVKDSNDITSRIQIGENGVIITSGDGTNQGSIAVSPDGNFLLVAGSETGPNTKLSLSEDAISIAAFLATSPMATVTAETNGKVTVSSDQEVKLDSPKIVLQGTTSVETMAPQTNLGGLGGLGVARTMDGIIGFGIGVVSGYITGGSTMVTAL